MNTNTFASIYGTCGQKFQVNSGKRLIQVNKKKLHKIKLNFNRDRSKSNQTESNQIYSELTFFTPNPQKTS